MLTDQDVIRHLRAKLGSYEEIGLRLKELSHAEVTPSTQMVCNWRKRGIPPAWRPYVAKLAIEYKLKGFREASFIQAALPKSKVAA
jgi:hypothetical protein